MRVRGLGKLELECGTHSVSETRSLIWIAHYDSSLKVSVVTMVLHTNQGLSSNRVDQILEAAKHKDDSGSVPGVILKNYNAPMGDLMGYRRLLFYCEGHIENIEGLMKKAASILKKGVQES